MNSATHDLNQPACDPHAWLLVTNPAVNINSQLTVTLPVNSDASYFRLAFP